MSRRLPPTQADRAIEALLKRFPDLRDLPDGQFDTLSDETAEALFGLMDRRPRLQHGFEMGELLMTDVSLWSRWRSSRHVYRFDRELSAELSDTEAPDDMPVDALRRLPYPVIYVDAPLWLVTTLNDRIECRGIFAYRDTAPDADENEVESLTLVYDCPDYQVELLPVSLSLVDGTFGGVIDDLIRSDERTVPYVGPGHREEVHKALSSAINHLLYVISKGAESEVVYVPSGKTKRPGKTSPSTVHQVGTQVGQALGEARRRYIGGSGSPDGQRTVRPHVRAGHWHHFWTGPRAVPERRELVVRWIPPVFVRGGDSSGTVVHRAD